MSWLQAERPELVGEYERRYRRAYLPSQEQRALSATVQELVAKCRGRFSSPAMTRAVGGPQHEPRPGRRQPSEPATQQLGLGV